MGKRAKKKIVQGGSPANKGSRSAPSSLSSSTAASSSTVSPSESGRFVENCGTAVDNSTSTRCPHGPNVEKLRTQLAKSTVIHCQDCTKLRTAVSAGKEQRKGGGKGSKVVRKKPLPPSSVLGDEKKSNYKLWVCLFCGQVGCGEGNVKIGGERSKHEVKQGVVGRGHAWQHWLQLKHPLVMLCGEEFSCWCFSCEVAHDLREGKHDDQDVPPGSENPSPLESEEDSLLPPSRDMLLHQAATLIREKLTQQLAVVREDSKDPTNGSDDAEKPNSPRGLENGVVHEIPEAPITTNARVMKGLVNLGNTCFFNSVMQNLLSVELLRSHFGPDSSLPEATLTSALRKFFLEASFCSPSEASGQLPEAGLKKNAKGTRGGWSSIDCIYNPKGLFGAICSKAPRFKGFQQQDSHELLRCLLDGLHTEEENALKDSLKSRTSGGEDALRALSESDARENGSNTEVDDVEDSDSPRQDAEGTTEKGVGNQKTGARQETFVDRAFGGQLSSTVSCCVCGHSSVVYESFLDLSLPIPSNKQPSKKAAALANGSSVTQSKTQKAQSFKSSKAKAKADSDLQAFRPIPAGLGTPLLLLPAPPPKDNNCDSGNTATESNWMDYIDGGTGSGETDWLDFISDDEEGEDSGAIIGCAPNPESQTVQDSAPNLESEMVFGCAPNPGLTQQSSAISVASEGKGILSPPADGSTSSMEFEERGYGEGADSFSLPNGKVISQSLDAPFDENIVLLEAAKEAIAESKNPSTVGCGSGLRPHRGQEMDMPVQMRGGSETHTLHGTQEAELDSWPVSEPLNGTNVCVEQSGDCNDDIITQSDIISGPNGSTVILLGPPVDTGSTSDFLNVELEGDYDGVGSLFEEEDSNEDRVYGPLPFNHSGADFQESAFDGIVFDDVLDLSRISEARGDWLVSNEEGQGEENAETSMSVEGCLQIFTRSELLSGENAWACENCTKKFHEGLAKDEKSTAVPEKPSMKSSTTKGGCGYSSNGSSKDPSIGDLISCDGNEDRELGSDGCSSRKGPDFDESEERASSSNVIIAGLEPSASFEMNGNVDVREDYAALDKNVFEVCQEGKSDNAGIVGTTSSQSSFEPVDLHGAGITSEPDGEMNDSNDARTLLGPEVANYSGGVGGEEVGFDKPDAEIHASQLENKVSQVSTRNSAKTSKLKKSKSRKVQEEQKKVIKQDATKRFLISRAPPVLTIQLKRFAQDMRGRLSKLSGHVAFQELLDLHPFLDHRYGNFDCKYRLIGTVEHSGTLKSGHYVAFVRGPPAQNPRNDTESTCGGASSWYYISDSHVHQTNLNAVLQSEAYLVFYERVDTTGVSHSK